MVEVQQAAVDLEVSPDNRAAVSVVAVAPRVHALFDFWFDVVDVLAVPFPRAEPVTSALRSVGPVTADAAHPSPPPGTADAGRPPPNAAAAWSVERVHVVVRDARVTVCAFDGQPGEPGTALTAMVEVADGTFVRPRLVVRIDGVAVRAGGGEVASDYATSIRTLARVPRRRCCRWPRRAGGRRTADGGL